jgi:hypothetical protein
MALQNGVRRGGEGRVYYALQTSFGEQVVPNLPLPYWANFTAGKRGHTAEVRAGGSRSPVELEEGMFGVEWSVSFPKVQGGALAVAFYNLVVAAGSPEELPLFSLGYGEDRNCFIVQDCKLDVRNLHGNAGDNEWLTGDASGFGGIVRAKTPVFAEQTYIDSRGMAMHEAVHSVCELAGFSSVYSNGLKMLPVVAGPSPSPFRASREWDYLVEGNETHSGEYRFFKRRTDLLPTADPDAPGGLNAKELPSWTDSLVWTNKANPYDAITLAWAGQKTRDEDDRLPGDDSEIEFTVPWLATGEVLSVT